MLMKALKINRHLAIRFALGALILCLSTTVIAIHSVYADTVIDGSLVQKVGDFRADNYGIQGGTISEKYYIFADSNSHGSTNGRTTIRFFDRKSGKEVSADSSLIMQDFKHASSLHYDWGTGYAQVGDASTGNWWCFSVKNRKQVSESKCKNGFLTSSGLGYGNTRQGWTKFGDYYFRAVGNEYDEGANITVYDKDRNFVENYVVPLSATDVCEIEDVAVDGNEGVLYMLCDDKAKGHYAGFYKIDKSVFSNYITASNEKRTAKNSAAKEKDASDYEKEAYVPSVSTYDGVVETTFFGTMQDDKEGCGVFTTLDLIITILTIGIGISATIGIAVSGIIYLTAKGDVAKTTKAKRRIYEIVIGLAAYAVIWALLIFLLPEFNPELKACKTLTAEEIAARNTRIEATRAENQSKQQSSSKTSRTPSSSDSSSNSSNNLSKWYQAINDAAKYMKKAKYGSNHKSNYKLAKKEATCITYPSIALQMLKVIPKNTYVWYNCGLTGSAANYIKKHKDVFEVIYPNKTASELKKQKNGIQKGDIVFYQYGSKCGVGHTMIFIKFNSKGKPLFNTFGKSGMKKNNAHPDGSKKIKMIIRLKKTTL